MVITDQQEIIVKSICLSNMEIDMILQVDGEELRVNDVSAFWFRRGFPKISYEESSVSLMSDQVPKEILSFLSREKSTLTHLFYLILAKKPNVNTALLTNLNKLDILMRAKLNGFRIPETMVTSHKKDIQSFFSANKGKVITKVLSDGLSMTVSNGVYLKTYTEIVTEEMLADCHEHFFPSVFQEEIIKKFEIRTFYLKGEFYSMAIFSQLNSITKTDFRRFENQGTPRSVPFNLPKEYELKLAVLINEIGLNCCSIDLAYSTNNEFVFFEINPIGQFGMVSYPCNYYLEKRMAEILAEKPTTNQ
jgi:ATP-GRASP peptide maturase of grasp-with-spasm system